MVKQIQDAFGEYGKAAIALLVSIGIGLIGWNLVKTNEHDATLAVLTTNSSSTHSLVEGLSEDVKALVVSIERHNELIDNKIGKIVDAAAEVRDEVRELQAAQAQRDMDAARLAPRRLGAP